MPSAVNGFTKQAAPAAAVVPGGSGRHCAALTQRYCEYISPASTATVLPMSCCAGAAVPAATTTPAPSLPTGSDWSTRPAMAFMIPAGMLAVTTGRSAVPVCRAVLMSAAPNSSPRSDGLIGVASTRIRTSSGPGCVTGTSIIESSSSPLRFTSERICSEVFGTLVVMRWFPPSWDRNGPPPIRRGAAGGVRVVSSATDTSTTLVPPATGAGAAPDLGHR